MNNCCYADVIFTVLYHSNGRHFWLNGPGSQRTYHSTSQSMNIGRWHHNCSGIYIWRGTPIARSQRTHFMHCQEHNTEQTTELTQYGHVAYGGRIIVFIVKQDNFDPFSTSILNVFTYSIEPILLEKPRVAQLLKNFRKFITVFTTSLVPILIQINPIHTVPYYISLRPILILSSTWFT
jgi:hypothetical protein